MTVIGPTFGTELRTAGVPLDGILWYSDGTINYAPSVSGGTKAQVAAVLAVHDSTKLAVPASVTRAQAKIQLMRAGLLDAVKAAVAQAGGETALWFDEALNWSRNDARIATIAGALGLNDAQVDALFIAASAIA